MARTPAAAQRLRELARRLRVRDRFYEDRPWAGDCCFDLSRACCAQPVDLVRWYLRDVEVVHAYANRSRTAERAGFHEHDTFVVTSTTTPVGSSDTPNTSPGPW